MNLILKTFTIAAGLLLLLSFSMQAQLTPKYDGDKGKWGYVDEKTNEWVIKPSFDNAEKFYRAHDGNQYAFVWKDNKISIIDLQGKTTKDCNKLDSVRPLQGSGNHYLVGYRNDKLRIIDSCGMRVNEDDFHGIEQVIRGAQEPPTGYIVRKGKKFGFLSPDCETLHRVEYDAISVKQRDGGNCNILLHKDKNSILCDMKGDVLMFSQYSNIDLTSDSEKFIVHTPQGVGVYDIRSAKEILTPVYHDIKWFLKGKDMIILAGKPSGVVGVYDYWMMDHAGNNIINETILRLEPLSIDGNRYYKLQRCRGGGVETCLWDRYEPTKIHGNFKEKITIEEEDFEIHRLTTSDINLTFIKYKGQLLPSNVFAIHDTLHGCSSIGDVKYITFSQQQPAYTQSNNSKRNSSKKQEPNLLTLLFRNGEMMYPSALAGTPKEVDGSIVCDKNGKLEYSWLIAPDKQLYMYDSKTSRWGSFLTLKSYKTNKITKAATYCLVSSKQIKVLDYGIDEIADAKVDDSVNESFVTIRKDGKYLLLKKTGDIIGTNYNARPQVVGEYSTLPAGQKNYSTNYISQFLVAVGTPGNYAVADTVGELRTEAIYDDIHRIGKDERVGNYFNSGPTPGQFAHFLVLQKGNHKALYNALTGKVVVPISEEVVNYGYSGMTLGCWKGTKGRDENEKLAILGTEGNIITPFIYDNIIDDSEYISAEGDYICGVIGNETYVMTRDAKPYTPNTDGSLTKIGEDFRFVNYEKCYAICYGISAHGCLNGKLEVVFQVFDKNGKIAKTWGGDLVTKRFTYDTDYSPSFNDSVMATFPIYNIKTPMIGSSRTYTCKVTLNAIIKGKTKQLATATTTFTFS